MIYEYLQVDKTQNAQLFDETAGLLRPHMMWSHEVV